jgi:hypothetical protein
MWVAALSRLARLFLLAAAVTLAGALVFGIALGADAARSISVGFYLTGSFLLVAGFFVGNRGPVRFRRDKEAPLFWGSRFVRWASPSERDENINLSAVFFVLGFVLILVGIAADNRYDLV